MYIVCVCVCGVWRLIQFLVGGTSRKLPGMSSWLIGTADLASCKHSAVMWPQREALLVGATPVANSREKLSHVC